jgi:TonB family protein
MWITLKKSCVWVSLLTVGLVGVMSPVGVTAQGEPPRKILRRVEPLYPPGARTARLSGTVKLSVVVTPDGKVKSSQVTGGHPLLAVAASDAVKQWAFEPGTTETTEPVAIVFDYSGGRPK